MDGYTDYSIQEMPLGTPFFRLRVERFLRENALSLEEVDVYYAVLDKEDNIIAGAGLHRDIIKCVAVAPAFRSEGLVAPLISHLVARSGGANLKVFTKPEYQAVFESLGFHLLASSPRAILLENGRGLDDYCRYLRSIRKGEGGSVIVMNANPLTLGHVNLVRRAAALGGPVYVIPLREDVAPFPYRERLEMIRRGLSAPAVMPGSDRASVVVAEGSDYCISAATFPTYFLKDLSEAAETQMRLDIDLFCRHIAPALGIRRRVVGDEPLDPLTARYNALLSEMLPVHGLALEVLPRFGTVLPGPDRASAVVSASAVRAALERGSLRVATALTPATDRPWLLAALAERALRLELDTPLKPGLVGPDSCGAHTDMDHALMRKGIDAIRPFFPQMALAKSADELRQLGIDAEAAMLRATGGVNTHRGAIFALGLALHAAASLPAMQTNLCQIAQAVLRNYLTDNDLHITPAPVKGPREMALGGYQELFEDWLPFYRSIKSEAWALQRLLLRIIATLDDTCVIRRIGYDRAQEVKAMGGEIPGQAGNDALSPAGNDAWATHLNTLCTRFAAEGISPGGAADMLALTLFIDSII